MFFNTSQDLLRLSSNLANLIFFKASALWADAFYKSICPYVCVFTFEVPFNSLFAPTSRSRMSNIFRDSEFLGKSNGRNGLTFEHLCLEVV